MPKTATEQHGPIRSFPLAAFFILAYAISWSLSLLATQDLLPFTIPAPLRLLSGLLYRFGPALAAIIVAASLGGRNGVRGLLRPLGAWRVPPKWYLFVFLYPPALHLVSVALGRAYGGPAPKFFDSASLGLPDAHPLLMGIVVFLGTFLLAGVAEEIGWRGFALPRLQRDRTALGASLILGFLWAIWQYHPLNVPSVRLFLPWHFLLVINMAILMTWIYNNTDGSLWMVALFHSMAIFSDWLIPTSPVVLNDYRALTVQVILQFATAVVVVLIFGSKWLRRERQATAPPLPLAKRA